MEGAMKFSSPLEARQFLIDKIITEAGRLGTPLSDVERRLLQLNLDDPASAAGIPLEVLEDSRQTHEKKIALLLKGAFEADGGNSYEQQRYREAAKQLMGSNHYVLIVAAAAIPRSRRLGDVGLYIIIGLVVIGLILVLEFWTRAK
jgi:hypothetical protein